MRTNGFKLRTKYEKTCTKPPEMLIMYTIRTIMYIHTHARDKTCLILQAQLPMQAV